MAASKEAPMRCRRVLVMTAVIWLGAGVDMALAQEPDHVGITMGFPTSVGVLCPLGAHFAIRPEFSWAHTSDVTTETGFVGGLPGASLTSSDATHLAGGVSVLVYVRRWDALRAYVSPRFTYSKATETINPPVLPASPSLTSREYSVSGSFGASTHLLDTLESLARLGLSSRVPRRR
jgi:hypothetical protein